MLKGKVALVTGGSRGIGREICLAFGAQGAKVAVNYQGNAQAAQEVADAICQAGGEAVAIGCAVQDSAAVEAMVAQVLERFGRLDILVNNAGITRDNLMLKITDQDLDSVLDVNLKGAFYTIRHAYKAFMKQRSGRIINISSVTALLGNGGQTNYTASKAGLIGLTKSIARELAARGVTANAIAPGFIETDMTSALPQAAREAILSQVPLKRMGSPKEVADLAVFLASDQAAYITGQVISVDGGMHM